MPRPHRFRAVLLLCTSLAAVLTGRADGRASGAVPRAAAPVPAFTLPLETFGYRPGTSAIALRSGYTNAALFFIDADHLLLTFSARKLMHRSEDQREGDDDHTVRAEVVHLPDGKIVRETEWRMHDRAPYLWPLANGKFLLRERGDLYALDPMGGARPDKLGQHLLLHTENDIESLQLSPAQDLLLVQTRPSRKVGDDPEEHRELPIAADFFRLDYGSNGTVQLHSRGHAVSRRPFTLAFTSMGVLQTVKEDRMHWGFDFRTYGGKKVELAGFTSTCRPLSFFVSDAEFFAYGCRGGEERRLMGGFNLLAEAKWVFTMDDAPLWLGISSAPASGRFAVRSTLTTSPAQESDRLGSEDIRAQEVRVYSSRQGAELLRVNCSPAQRPGGNFALAPDGLRLALLHGTQLEVYNLPAVSPDDAKLYQREQTSLQPLRPSAELNVVMGLTSDGGESAGSRK